MKTIKHQTSASSSPAAAIRAERIFILGTGAIGLPLAAFLTAQGANVTAVRTRKDQVPEENLRITVNEGGQGILDVPVQTVSLSSLRKLDGLVVVAVKSHFNNALASVLRNKAVTGPLVILQNGMGVENPFLESGFPDVRRAVLYVTAQPVSREKFTFRPIASSPLGTIKGTAEALAGCASALTTPWFPFHAEEEIQTEVWKKTIINAVFNSLCPLLDTDNGVFARSGEVRLLADEVVRECVGLAQHMGIALTGREIMERIMRISRGSDGVLISTLQDIRNGRETEIASLNLEMARMASLSRPGINLVKTELLGRLVAARSRAFL